MFTRTYSVKPKLSFKKLHKISASQSCNYSNFKPTVLNPTGNVLLETDKEKIEKGELLYYKNAHTINTTFDLYKVEGEDGEKVLIGKFKDQFEAVMSMEKQPRKESIMQRFWIERNNNDNKSSK